ncbi:MAG: WXG100 family type VII secretion target [Oscillospiraceae bacterium]|nr:WXG100 family type VII secretion target [Oscillospiraceae bacterium]
MGTIYMDTAQVERSANSVDTLNNKIETKLESVTDAVNNMDNAWDGESADAAAGFYTGKIRPLLDSQKTLIKNFTNYMRQCIASGYEQTEQVNTQQAESYKSLSDSFK